MKFRSVWALAVLCAIAGLSRPGAAQEPEDPYDRARFQLGAFHFTPSLEITSLGRDTNVFNESDDPKSDTTAAVGPGVQVWLRPWGTRFSGKFGAQYLYFKQYGDQRAWNTGNQGLWEFPLARFTPFVSGRYINSRERQGYEIDSRARRTDKAVQAGTRLRVSGKTELIGSYQRSNVKYDEKETFLGATLAEQLDRREDRTELQFRYAMTPLTTLVVRGETGKDRFQRARLRDSDTVRVMPGFELKPFALISGQVFVGYRRLNAVDERLPDYSGVAALVNATYVRGSTRFEVKVDRDISYSYAPAHPYYALLDTGLTVTQHVYGGWEGVGRVSRQALAYRQLSSDSTSIPTDRGYIYGGGVGYRVGEALRLGMDVNYSTRRSEFEGRRDFEGLRVFGSIAYATQQ